MADTNHIRRDDYVEFSENDPFAELTRIMGHDPRVQGPAVQAAPAPAEAAAAPADDDFEIDLERELAADFDFSEFDEPAAVADWRREEQAGEPAAEQAAQPDRAALDIDFDDFLTEEAKIEEPVAAASVPGPAYEAQESLDDALERELFSEQASFAAEPEPVYDAPVHETGDAPAYEAEPAYEAPAAYEAASVHDATAADPAGDDWAAEAEFDLDFLERELAASAPPVEPRPAPQAVTPPPPASFEAEPFPEPEEPEEAAAGSADRPLSLEEELNLLLADDPAPAPGVAAQPQRPAGTAFGRANFAPAQPAAAAPAFAMAPAAYRPEAAPAAPAADARPAFTPIATPAPAPAYTPAPAPVDAVAEDDLHDLFGDDFALDLDGEAGARKAAAAELPDIETVEVAETVQPVADDLDIPEVDYGAPAAPASGLYDDLEADFADVFGDVASDEPKPAAAVAASAAAPAPQAEAGYVLDDTRWQAAQAFPDAGFDHETDLEQAIAMSAYEDEQPRPAPRRRGLLAAAVVGGLVVLGAAGIFGMSMFGGGSDTPALVRADPEPMKVRPENPGGTTVPNQDNEVYQRVSGGPSDAAPEQESLITTAEEPVDVAARTVTPQEPAALAPGIDDGTPAAVAQPKSEDRIEQPPQAASPVEAEETAVVAPRRVRTMVVRPDGTMVPREDPAPVAAGQPAAATAQPGVIRQPAGAAETAVLAPAGEAAPASDTLAAEADEGPTVETPQTVAVVPTQRSEPQAAPARPAAPAPQPAVQQPAAQAPVAAAPVSAPAAAAAAGAGEWSMQIASQPTAEGAQSTYQDLARRYGSVLEGRGVNIVRADIEGRGVYYRVRIPASSREEAIQLCTRYKAAGGSCFVSR